MIAASGNYSSSSPYYPASYDEVISVGAVDNEMQRANYSNYGPHLDLVAPGGSSSVQILSTGYSANEGNTYSYMAGTSMAAPHVTGLAALLMAKGYAGKDDSGEEIIRKILRETALDLGENGRDAGMSTMGSDSSRHTILLPTRKNAGHYWFRSCPPRAKSLGRPKSIRTDPFYSMDSPKTT